jgi:hypothetical protein
MATRHKQPPASFWQQLSQLASSNPNVLKLIVQQLDEGASVLRAVDCGMRRAVNRTVYCIQLCCSTHYAFPDKDLADIFPEADELRVVLGAQGSPLPLMHVALLLDGLTSLSPRLLQKLRTLHLQFAREPPTTFKEELNVLLARFVRTSHLAIFNPIACLPS